MSFGLDSNGFTAPTTQQLITLMVADLQTAFGPTFALNPLSPEGQLVATFADQLANAWAAQEQAYNAFFPDTASGSSLDNLAGITGLTRLGAVATKLALRFFMDAVYPGPSPAWYFYPGAMRAHPPSNTGAQFTNVDFIASLGNSIQENQHLAIDGSPTSGNMTLTFGADTTAAIAWDPDPTVMAADMQTKLNALASVTTAGGVVVYWNPTYVAPVAGGTPYIAKPVGWVINFNSGGVDQSAIVVASNSLSPAATLTVIELNFGGIYQDFANFPALLTGPTSVPVGTALVMDTPASHVTSVKVIECITGRDGETDAALRVRRLQQLQQLSAAVRGIIQGLSVVTDVTKVSVVENDTDTTDGAGRPPHSVEAVVTGGLDADVALALFNYKAAGIATYGNTTAVVVDSQGNSHTIKFSRPSLVNVYVTVTLVTNSDAAVGPTYPVSGNTAVQEAIVAYGETLQAGQSVTVPAIEAAVMTVAGVFGITVNLGTSPSPSGTTNLTFSSSQVPTMLTSTVVVAP